MHRHATGDADTHGGDFLHVTVLLALMLTVSTGVVALLLTVLPVCLTVVNPHSGELVHPLGRDAPACQHTDHNLFEQPHVGFWPATIGSKLQNGVGHKLPGTVVGHRPTALHVKNRYARVKLVTILARGIDLAVVRDLPGAADGKDRVVFEEE